MKSLSNCHISICYYFDNIEINDIKNIDTFLAKITFSTVAFIICVHLMCANCWFKTNVFLFYFSIRFFSSSSVRSVSFTLLMDIDGSSLNAPPMKMKRRIKRQPKLEMVGSGGIVYESSLRGNRLLHYMGHKYIKNNVHGANVYWKCTKWHNGCKARAITNMTASDSCFVKNVHNHDEISTEFNWITFQHHSTLIQI